MLIAWLIFVASFTLPVDVSAVLESAYASHDFELNPDPGRELRIGLFRIAGANPRQRYAWRPTGADTFHVPQAFGTLRLR